MARKPTPRKATAYWYVKPANKTWLAAKARELGVSRSEAADLFLDTVRKQYPVGGKTPRAA